jgi:hypothetical protein
MNTANLTRCAAFLLLALCLSGADCGKGAVPPEDDPDVVDPVGDVDCSNTSPSSYAKTTGRFDVTVDRTAVGPWRLGLSPVPRPDGSYEVWLSACVQEGGGVETWRYSSIVYLKGLVQGTPEKLPVPASRAPGFTGGLLDVLGNREHHFFQSGGGVLEVQEFDPKARRFIAQGEVYPEQGGTVTLSWDLTW